MKEELIEGWKRISCVFSKVFIFTGSQERIFDLMCKKEKYSHQGIMW